MDPISYHLLCLLPQALLPPGTLLCFYFFSKLKVPVLQKLAKNEPKMSLYLLTILACQAELPELKIKASPYFLYDKKYEECLLSQSNYLLKEPK